MNTVASKALNYFRAVWLVGNQNANLENLLREALNKKPIITDRKFAEKDGTTMEMRHVLHTNEAVYLHIASYTPGTKATTVPLVAEVDQADLNTLDAPADQEFMDGDAMLRCAGNDLIVCLSGMSKAATEPLSEVADFRCK